MVGYLAWFCNWYPDILITIWNQSEVETDNHVHIASPLWWETCRFSPPDVFLATHYGQ